MQCADLWPNLAQGKTPSGGGGLLSTGNDYIKFAECLTRGGVSESGFRWRIGILPENAVVVNILCWDTLQTAAEGDRGYDDERPPTRHRGGAGGVDAGLPGNGGLTST